MLIHHLLPRAMDKNMYIYLCRISKVNGLSIKIVIDYSSIVLDSHYANTFLPKLAYPLRKSSQLVKYPCNPSTTFIHKSINIHLPSYVSYR